MKSKRNVFWGVALLLGAAAMLMSRFGYLEGIGFWSVLFSICLVAILIRGIARGGFGTILFSIAFLVIVNDKLLGLEAITPWPVLGAAFLGTIGLHLLFPKFGRHRRGHFLSLGEGERVGVEEFGREGAEVFCENTFGESTKYISGAIEQVKLDNTFGTLQIYFTEAQPVNGLAHVDLDSSFGSVVLYVPSRWRVDLLNVETAFGSAQESGKCSPDGENVLEVTGDVNFGSLEVVYVGEGRKRDSSRAQSKEKGTGKDFESDFTEI